MLLGANSLCVSFVWAGRSAVDMFEACVAQYGDTPAIITAEPSSTTTYAQLDRRYDVVYSIVYLDEHRHHEAWLMITFATIENHHQKVPL